MNKHIRQRRHFMARVALAAPVVRLALRGATVVAAVALVAVRVMT